MRTLALLLILPTIVYAQGTKADYERANALSGRLRETVSNESLKPHWVEGGFWYKRDIDKGDELVLVDAKTGTKTVVEKDALPKELVQPIPRRPRAKPGERDWTAFIKNDNVWIRHNDSNEEVQLSKEGTPKDGYRGRFFWSPDGKKLIVHRRKEGGDRRVTLVESSPRDQLQPKTSSYFYLKPGDDIPLSKPHLFDIESKKEIQVSDELFPNPWSVDEEHWSPDSKQFTFLYNQRGHGIVRVLAIDAATGNVTPIVDEECKTFFDYTNKQYLQHLDDSDELLWMSERSGWNHLYLVDCNNNTAKPITHGEWVVRGIENVDIKNRAIVFSLSGIDADQDPYHIHFARINFDGTGFTRLTDGDGTHSLQWSPNREFYLDTFSRVDLPPVYELRHASDGTLVTKLEEADATKLLKVVTRLPERFVAKGRDGKTDIWGMIHRPSNFDPEKQYPVIEYIYAGPHGQHVPKSFRTFWRQMELAELGFIIVRIDGMGTNWRSKAFHDVCWKNLGDAGFPDRIKWIETAAKQYPEFDISNGVGIYGGSAGGQNTMRGMTEYPEFYTVGVADCGCHDNRMDKIWWNEMWMSWPIGPWYKEQSNVTNAHKIEGKLMLVVGELDNNVDPSSTLQVVDALMKADKDFDFLYMTGKGHGACESPYGNRRRMDFFVRNLMSQEPSR